MTQIILTTILNKIKSISKECETISIPDTSAKNQSQINFESYLKALDMIRGQLIKFRQLQDQYFRLEAILQKMEADMRRKIAFEQQIKIYNDTIKAQVEQVQIEKFQLLQNSIRTIKQLKKINQELYDKLNSKSDKNDKKEEKSGVKNLKTRRVSSFGGKTSSNAGITNKIRVNKDEDTIIETEFIEREQITSLAKNKEGLDLDEFIQGSEQKDIDQSGKKNRNGGKTDREIIISKKKQRKVYSNSNLFNMLRTNRKNQQYQLKDIYLPKSPDKNIQTKKPKNKFKNINRSVWKDKLANKSVNSITSMQPVVSNKQTL